MKVWEWRKELLQFFEDSDPAAMAMDLEKLKLDLAEAKREEQLTLDNAFRISAKVSAELNAELAGLKREAVYANAMRTIVDDLMIKLDIKDINEGPGTGDGNVDKTMQLDQEPGEIDVDEDAEGDMGADFETGH